MIIRLGSGILGMVIVMQSRHQDVQQPARRLGEWSRRLRAQGVPGDPSRRSQAELAGAAGVSTTTISAFERGGRQTGTANPHLDVVVGVARAHGISVSDFVALAETPLDATIDGVVTRVAEALGIPKMKIEYLRQEIQQETLEHRDPTLVRRAAPSLEMLSDRTGQPSSALEQAVRHVEFMAELASEIAEELAALYTSCDRGSE